MFLLVFTAPVPVVNDVPTQMTWHSNRQVITVLKAMMKSGGKAASPSVNLGNLGNFKNVDLEVQFYGRTGTQYYKLSIRLKRPVGKLHRFYKSIECWGRRNGTTIRTTIDIGYGRDRRFPFRWINVIKRNVIRRIKGDLLNKEYWAIQRLGR